MSLNKQKCDPELGAKVREHLKKVGLETPLNPKNDLSTKEKIATIQTYFHKIMVTLGLDLNDDSLIDTPKRVAKMFVSEIYYGLDTETFPKCTAVDNKMKYDEMVVERNINVQSSCEHHFVNIAGFATVGYIPNEKVLGLSKMNRIVEYFSKRPQIQERLTSQIYHAMSFILDTPNVAVMLDAKHYCVAARGVEDTGSTTITSHLGGVFKDDPATRSEFIALANKC